MGPVLHATCALAAVCLLLAPTSAKAATAHVETRVIPPSDPKTGSPTTESTVFYDALQGEVNAVTLRRDRIDSTDSIVVSDPGNTIMPAQGCSSEAPDRVRCTGPGLLGGVDATAGDRDDSFTPGEVELSVDLGAGDDRVIATAAGLRAEGGEGNDVLACSNREYSGCYLDGGDGSDQLTAGSRGSELTGGRGADRIMGGAGADIIKDGGNELDHDVLAGGAGRDLLSYADDTEGVRVNLTTQGPSGRRGEGDLISGIEDAEGGSGPDVLVGNDGDNHLEGGKGRDILDGRGGADGLVAGGLAKDRHGNRLRGGPGNDALFGAERRDVLDAGPGNDELEGGAGADRLLGGPGDDRLNGGPGRDRYDAGGGRDLVQPGGLEGEAGSIACGAGRDTLQDPGPRDLVGASCELVTWLPEFVFNARGVRGNTAVFRFKCSTYVAEGRRCRGRIALVAHGRVLARATYAMRRGRWRWLLLRLTPAAARALHRRRRLRVTVRARSDKPYGHLAYRVDLRR